MNQLLLQPLRVVKPILYVWNTFFVKLICTYDMTPLKTRLTKTSSHVPDLFFVPSNHRCLKLLSESIERLVKIYSCLVIRPLSRAL